MLEQFEGKSDHDLLVVAVTDLGHIKTHLAKVEANGVKKDERLSALEKWRWTTSGAFVLIGAGWPLLIYEVRQFLLDKFGFIP